MNLSYSSWRCNSSTASKPEESIETWFGGGGIPNISISCSLPLREAPTTGELSNFIYFFNCTELSSVAPIFCKKSLDALSVDVDGFTVGTVGAAGTIMVLLFSSICCAYLSRGGSSCGCSKFNERARSSMLAFIRRTLEMKVRYHFLGSTTFLCLSFFVQRAMICVLCGGCLFIFYCFVGFAIYKLGLIWNSFISVVVFLLSPGVRCVFFLSLTRFILFAFLCYDTTELLHFKLFRNLFYFTSRFKSS